MQEHMKPALSLRNDAFFRTMSANLLMRIERYAFYRDYEMRQIIYFPDDVCDHVYWVCTGRVKITRALGDGRELTFRHLLPGDIFGEECLLNRSARGAYAEAMAPTVLCLMRADDFRRTVREEAEVSLKVTQRLVARVIDTEDVLAHTVFKPVRSRVAAGLLRLYKRTPKSENGRLYVTHQEIANLIGSTRETTTAVLHDLREEGMVSMANRRLTVLDPAALEQEAEGP